MWIQKVSVWLEKFLCYLVQGYLSRYLKGIECRYPAFVFRVLLSLSQRRVKMLNASGRLNFLILNKMMETLKINVSTALKVCHFMVDVKKSCNSSLLISASVTDISQKGNYFNHVNATNHKSSSLNKIDIALSKGYNTHSIRGTQANIDLT